MIPDFHFSQKKSKKYCPYSGGEPPFITEHSILMENIGKYIEDERFIRWVFDHDPQLNEWWHTYEASHPEEKNNIRLARRVLKKLRTVDQELPENEKIVLFSRILKEIEERGRRHKTRIIMIEMMKYAAIALLFFSAGVLLFPRHQEVYPTFAEQELRVPFKGEEAKLMREGEEDILLSDRNSKIEYREDGQVVVNDSVLGNSGSLKRGVPGMNQLVIPYGKTSEVLLPDGSRVWLNAGSRLIYPEFFPDKTREVFLSGEAFFNVRHDAGRPFVVKTADIRVNVLGTQFNLSAYSGDQVIETVLTEGKIKISQNNAGLFAESMEISPGQLAAYSKENHSFMLSEVDIENHTLWKEGLMKFESTDLSRIVKKLERYYNIRFRYQDPLLGGIKISGKLELNERCDAVLGIVADAASVKIAPAGEGYFEITRK